MLRSHNGRCSIKKVFLKISLNSQENTCTGSLFNNVEGLRACDFLKNRLKHQYFSVNFAKFIRAASLQNTPRLLLQDAVPLGFFIQR